MASFAKATKWLLAGDKIRGKAWSPGCWARIENNIVVNQHGEEMVFDGYDLAVTDYVRLVPRKRVDESLYEPVGTMPQVGDRIIALDASFPPYTLPQTVTRICADYAYIRAGGCEHHYGLVYFNEGGSQANRILKRPERNVFTDPRAGDVVASEFGGTWKVIAVTAEGVMCISDMKGVFGWHRNDWAAHSGRWTVKHRAEGGAK